MTLLAVRCADCGCHGRHRPDSTTPDIAWCPTCHGACRPTGPTLWKPLSPGSTVLTGDPTAVTTRSGLEPEAPGHAALWMERLGVENARLAHDIHHTTRHVTGCRWCDEQRTLQPAAAGPAIPEEAYW